VTIITDPEQKIIEVITERGPRISHVGLLVLT